MSDSEERDKEPPATKKKKKMYCVNDRPCSSAWFHKTEKRKRDEAKLKNYDRHHEEVNLSFCEFQ